MTRNPFRAPWRKAPETYADWKARALHEDRRSGADQWRDEEASTLYDHRVIRLRYDELAEVRRSGDPDRLIFYFNEGLHGNMGGMGSPALYAQAMSGTKRLIEAYLDELVAAIDDLETLEESFLSTPEKIALLERSSACFGRSALMLSGAGSLGAFHVGVARALSQQGLIPPVISGASAGAIVTAIIGTRRDGEAADALSPSEIDHAFEILRGGDESRRRSPIALEDLRSMIEQVVPDVTFLEAYRETGKEINISVAPATLHQRSRLLNAITSPNALIREAVLASCAIPGVFPAVTLAARDAKGRRCPYVPSRQWVDGSITDDLPARRLARLYGVNHFISSQANPIVFWALPDPHTRSGLPARLLDISWSASQQALRAVYPFAMGATRNLRPLGTYTRLWFSVMTQEYGADINISLSRRYLDPRLFLARLSREDAAALVRAGEQATWPKIQIIRNCTQVSRALERSLSRLRSRARTPAAVRA